MKTSTNEIQDIITKIKCSLASVSDKNIIDEAIVDGHSDVVIYLYETSKDLTNDDKQQIFISAMIYNNIALAKYCISKPEIFQEDYAFRRAKEILRAWRHSTDSHIPMNDDYTEMTELVTRLTAFS